MREIQTPGAAVHVNQYTRTVIEQAIERMEDPRDVWGIPTGYADFDRITGGLQPGEVLNVSGDPGIGKSIFVDQMGFQMALCDRPGVIYTLEMPGEQVVRRRLSYASRMAMREIKTGRFAPERLADLERAVEDINALPLYMSDSVHWSTASLRADLTRLKALREIEWFVLDYAYLLQDGRGLSENDKTGLISAQLKGICRSLRLAGVVILSQNKEGMREKAKTGVGLRGSGQQFYDADLILFLNEIEDEKGAIMVTFGKGRELEESKKGFRLTRIAGFPAFGDYSPMAQGRNGRRP
jgi:replicative DNA helicase